MVCIKSYDVIKIDKIGFKDMAYLRFWLLLLLLSIFQNIYEDFFNAKEVNPQMESHSSPLQALLNNKSHALIPDVFRNKMLHIRCRRTQKKMIQFLKNARFHASTRSKPL